MNDQAASPQTDQQAPQAGQQDPVAVLEELIAKRKQAQGTPSDAAVQAKEAAEAAKKEQEEKEAAAARQLAELEQAQQQAQERDTQKILEQKQAIEDMSHSVAFQEVAADEAAKAYEKQEEKTAQDGFEIEQVKHIS